MNQENFTKQCCAIVAGVLLRGKESSALLLLLFTFFQTSFSQRGGERVFEFIHLPTSARATALGGSQIAAWTDDYGLAGGNPALLSQDMSGQFLFQHNFHFAGIDNGYAGYAKHFAKLNSTLHGGVHYLSYGNFTAADDRGNVTGEFKANEISLQAGISRRLNERMQAGLLLRYVQSSFESYQSSGLVADAGITYQSENGLNHYAFVLRGIGTQFSTYYPDDEKGRMPVDVQIGLSKRLEYVPFRLSVLLHDLNRWDLRYESPLDEETGLGFGEEPREPGFFGQQVDNVFRHIVFGGEFIIGKKENLMLRIGYHHQRRKELSVVGLRSLAGFSAGAGVRLKSFILDYGFAIYHQAGSTKHLGLRIHIDQLMRKKIVE